MPKPVVVLAERIAEREVRRLAETVDVRIADAPAGEGLRRSLVGADAQIVRSTPLEAADIASGPGLRVIGRHGVGTENIDVVAASAHGIPVVNTPGANAHSVAEFTVLLALTALRRLPEITATFAAEHSIDGSLPGWLSRSGLLGAMLEGRTVGLLGFGAIGRRAATLFEAHGARVIFHDPFVTLDDPRARTWPGLLAASEVLSIHVPLTADTVGMLDAASLSALPPGAVVVNTARAEIVETAPLLAALDSGAIGVYAVDVFAPEPPDPADPLLAHPRVIATPHMAAMTHDAIGRMASSVVDGVLAVLAGERPLATVNPEVYG
ncbi:NAD(P)-dependent oxidoreductase [Pseudolysinimonas sp.]|uniref:NAD(P)-dependent oxidoreductase n=1 Tax=Pseudolysinimonas sp. TaxID=2680009 RepID=UPI00378423A9